MKQVMIDNNLITVDGKAAVGKGTISKLLASKLDWNFLDSGVMYRALALLAIKVECSLKDEKALTSLALELDVLFSKDGRILLNGSDVSEQVRSQECGSVASKIAVFPLVRDALLARQRDFYQLPGLVADGRDMGTIVFPNAKCKLFLTASDDKRAKRRYNELKNKGINVSLSAVLSELQARDERDSNRQAAPLQAAADAYVIDTTELSINDVFKQALLIVNKSGIK